MKHQSIENFLEKKKKIAWLILIIVGFLIYANALPNKMFWDDDDGILNNVYIKDWKYFGKYFSENLIAGAGLMSNYWRPLLLISYSIEWHLWKDWAPGYHFTNIAIHLANAILLFYLLKILFKKFLLSLGVALIFLAHPLQTEAVTYVSGRGDPLSVFFIFLGIIFYLKYLKSKNKSFYFLSLGSYIFGLMTKETAIILPALLILVDIYLWQKEPFSIKKFLKEEGIKLLPFFLLAGIYSILRITILNFKESLFEFYFAKDISTRIFTFLKILPVYFSLLFFPVNLHMERSMEVVTSFLNPQVILGFTLFIALIILALLFLRRKPEYTFSIFWFFIGLALYSNIFIPMPALIYEHWLYLPLIGFFLLLGFGLSDISKKFPKAINLFAPIILIFILFLSVQTIRRNFDWRDPITFYNNVLKYNQKSLRIWNNLGMAYADAKEYDKAIEAYKKAIELDLKGESAPPHHNLANTYQELGMIEEAISEYEKAISIDERFIFSYNALANLYFKQKKYDEAAAVLKRAAKIFPDNLQIRHNLLIIEQTKKEIKE